MTKGKTNCSLCIYSGLAMLIEFPTAILTKDVFKIRNIEEIHRKLMLLLIIRNCAAIFFLLFLHNLRHRLQNINLRILKLIHIKLDGVLTVYKYGNDSNQFLSLMVLKL